MVSLNLKVLQATLHNLISVIQYMYDNLCALQVNNRWSIMGYQSTFEVL